MTDNRRRRFTLKVDQNTTPGLLERSKFKISESVSHLKQDQSKYEKYINGSRWRNFVLPQFSHKQDSIGDNSRVTYSRVGDFQSRSRTLTQIDGFNFQSNKSSQHIKKRMKSGLTNSQYPLVSNFSLVRDTANNQLSASKWGGNDRSSMSSLSKPSLSIDCYSTSIGTQTQASKYTEMQFDILKQQVQYLRKFVYRNASDGFNKNKEQLTSN